MELKAPTRCPRCQGRMTVESDWVSTDATCFMCGHVVELVRDVGLGQPLASQRSGNGLLPIPRGDNRE